MHTVAKLENAAGTVQTRIDQAPDGAFSGDGSGHTAPAATCSTQ